MEMNQVCVSKRLTGTVCVLYVRKLKLYLCNMDTFECHEL